MKCKLCGKESETIICNDCGESKEENVDKKEFNKTEPVKENLEQMGSPDGGN